MKPIVIFLNTETGDMEPYESLDVFREVHPNLDVETRNDHGDRIVQTKAKPWGKTLGYLQERYIRV